MQINIQKHEIHFFAMVTKNPVHIRRPHCDADLQPVWHTKRSLISSHVRKTVNYIKGIVVESFHSLNVSLSGDLPQHLQVMFKILRSEDRIKLVSTKMLPCVALFLLLEAFISFISFSKGEIRDLKVKTCSTS